jgi:hypothetical protein
MEGGRAKFKMVYNTIVNDIQKFVCGKKNDRKVTIKYCVNGGIGILDEIDLN